MGECHRFFIKSSKILRNQLHKTLVKFESHRIPFDGGVSPFKGILLTRRVMWRVDSSARRMRSTGTIVQPWVSDDLLSYKAIGSNYLSFVVILLLASTMPLAEAGTATGVYPLYACISLSIGDTMLCYSSKFAERPCLYQSVIHL